VAYSLTRVRTRDDSWLIPSARMIPLAQRFAAAEPGLVSMQIDDEELKLSEAGNQPGERYLHKLLREKGPAYALVREWAYAIRVPEELKADNHRLRSQLCDAVSLFRAHCQEREA
jgi:hypothetical protein